MIDKRVGSIFTHLPDAEFSLAPPKLPPSLTSLPLPSSIKVEPSPPLLTLFPSPQTYLTFLPSSTKGKHLPSSLHMPSRQHKFLNLSLIHMTKLILLRDSIAGGSLFTNSTLSTFKYLYNVQYKYLLSKTRCNRLQEPGTGHCTPPISGPLLIGNNLKMDRTRARNGS